MQGDVEDGELSSSSQFFPEGQDPFKYLLGYNSRGDAWDAQPNPQASRTSKTSASRPAAVTAQRLGKHASSSTPASPPLDPAQALLRDLGFRVVPRDKLHTSRRRWTDHDSSLPASTSPKAAALQKILRKVSSELSPAAVKEAAQSAQDPDVRRSDNSDTRPKRSSNGSGVDQATRGYADQSSPRSYSSAEPVAPAYYHRQSPSPLPGYVSADAPSPQRPVWPEPRAAWEDASSRQTSEKTSLAGSGGPMPAAPAAASSWGRDDDIIMAANAALQEEVAALRHQHKDNRSTVDKCKAQISTLERQNAELQRQLADMQASQAKRAESTWDMERVTSEMRENLEKAEARAKSREALADSLQRQLDLRVSELKAVQEELSKERAISASLKDELATSRDRVIELLRDLDQGQRKLVVVADESRRQEAELVALRKERHNLLEVYNKARVDMSELREKLHVAQAETNRGQSAHGDSGEREMMMRQLQMMREHMAEVEKQNSYLQRALATSRSDMMQMRYKSARPMAQSASPELYGALQQQGAAPWMGTMRPSSPGWAADGLQRANGHALVDTVRTSRDGAGHAGSSALAQWQPRPSSPGPSQPSNWMAEEGQALRQHSSGHLPYTGQGAYNSREGQGSGQAYGARVPDSHTPPHHSHDGQGQQPRVSYGGQGGFQDLYPPYQAADGSDGYSYQPVTRSDSWMLGTTGRPDASTYPQSAAAQLSNYSNPSQQQLSPSTGAVAVVGPRNGYSRAANGSPHLGPDRMRLYNDLIQELHRSGSPQEQALIAVSRESSGLSSSDKERMARAVALERSVRFLSPDRQRPSPIATWSHAMEVTESSSHAQLRSPFGTEQTLQDMMERTKVLEDALLNLNQERKVLETEYARMPTHNGRTLRERQRKVEVEGRLEQLNKQISAMRLQLKRIYNK